MPPASHGAERPCAIFVGGFGRDAPTHLRREQFEAQVKPKIAEHLLDFCKPKFPHLQKYYTTVVDDVDSMRDVLECLKNIDFPWFDPTFKVTKKVFCKVDKNVEQRALGKFRHHLYAAIAKFLTTHPSFPEGSPPKLQMVRGTIHVECQNDSLGLLSFTRELVKDQSGMEANYDN